MTIRIPTFLLLALFLVLGFAACGAPQGGRTSDFSQDTAAVWRVDEDANLAFPTCPRCGADVDRTATKCPGCGSAVRVEPMSIKCPECKGSAKCAHCAAAGCTACAGSNLCAICDGTGKWRGEACPECEGAKDCVDCRAAGDAKACERCAETCVCANCAGTGQITLK